MDTEKGTGAGKTNVADPVERHRLEGVYTRLREKLLDLTKRNRMLNYPLGARSKRHVQIFDEVPEEIFRATSEILFLFRSLMAVDPMKQL